jgi:hypothetical protein
MRGILGLAALPALAAGSPLFIDTIHNDAAPIVSSVNSKHVPNSYIVVFKDHVTKDAAEAHHLWVQGVHDDHSNERMELRKRSMASDQESIFSGLKHTYHIPGKFLGYSGHFDEDVIEKVRSHPDVSPPKSCLSPVSASCKTGEAPGVCNRSSPGSLELAPGLEMPLSSENNAHVRYRSISSRLTQKSTP